MKRYDIEAECTVGPMNADMYERANGAYVRWADLIAAGVLVPAPPAAGPWRYDLENAPRDGSLVLCKFGGLTFYDIVVAEWRDGLWKAIGANYADADMLAFAAINRPEIKQ